MPIYNAAHLGAGFELSESGNGIRIDSEYILDSTTIKGYFSRKVLGEILSFPNCVGLRLYNVIFNENGDFGVNSGLIAVSVDETGNEGGNYHQSHHPINGNHNDALPQLDDPVALVEHMGGLSEDEFTTFFSRSMIEFLLGDQDFSGVKFYDAKLISPDGGTGLPLNPTLRTHIGIPSNINADGSISTVPEENAEEWVGNRICDIPCPGHCIDIDKDGERIVTLFTLLDEPYLFSWED